MNRRLGAWRSLGAALCGVFAWAGAADARSVEIQPWVQLFAHYEYNVSAYDKADPRYGDIDNNRFEITRAWLGADAKLTSRWSAHLIFGAVRSRAVETAAVSTGVADDPATPEDESRVEVISDIGPERDGQYEVLLYKAFLRYTRFRYGRVDFGVISDAYTPGISKFWRHRYVLEYPLFDHRLSRSPYGDLGVALWGEIPGGFGGYRFTAINGEGIRNAEPSAGKAFETRVHLFPLALSRVFEGLGVMGYCRVDQVEADAPEVTHTVFEALGSYRLDFDDRFGFSLAGEYIERNIASDDPTVPEATSTIASAWADVRLWRAFGLVARADVFDPDSDNDEATGKGYHDEETSWLAGVWIEPEDFFRACLNLRQTSYTAERVGSDGASTTIDPDGFVFLNTEFVF